MGTIVVDSAGNALFGKTRRKILSFFYSRPNESFYIREIIRFLRLGNGAVQRELANLAEGKILLKERKGREVFYKINVHCPVYQELQLFFTKTSGISSYLAKSLRRIEKRVEIAFIFGSVAKGNFDEKSDIDLLIVGNATLKELVDLFEPAALTLNREINTTPYSVQEFQTKWNSKHHFLHSVVKGPKIFVLGDENVLEGLVSKTVD